MGQVTIYLDEETERRIKTAAESAGMSLSKWVSNVVREKTENIWPEAVLKLAGAWPDFPEAEELRQSQPADTHRESF
ncbi:MAG: hypothetical protein WD696_08635 [Bryobacteraceae bacterium]